MGRRNIFDIMNNFDFDKDFELIYNRFGEEVIFTKIRYGDSYNYNIEYFVNEYGICNWKQRSIFHTTKDILDRLDLNNDHINKWDYDKKINWIEYALNMTYIALRAKNGSMASYLGKFKEEEISETIKNINYVLEKLGYEFKHFEEEEKVIIVQKNKYATSVAEFVNDDLARDIFEYNRFNMKGELSEKRKIILEIAREYEGFENEIKNKNKELGTDLGFLLNKFHLRHNNQKDVVKDEHCKKFFDLNEEEQEKWYDYTYDLLLLAFLEKDASKIHEELSEFKKKLD